MITPSFFALESRRFFYAALGFGATWLLTEDVTLSLTVLAAVLAASWGWQLAKLYRWFEQPEEFPPISGAGMRGILHDVYVLRSRESQPGTRSVLTQPNL